MFDLWTRGEFCIQFVLVILISIFLMSYYMDKISPKIENSSEIQESRKKLFRFIRDKAMYVLMFTVFITLLLTSYTSSLQNSPKTSEASKKILAFYGQKTKVDSPIDIVLNKTESTIDFNEQIFIKNEPKDYLGIRHCVSGGDVNKCKTFVREYAKKEGLLSGQLM